ncbi:IclR family transcriptional regulator [soil metagenome]
MTSPSRVFAILNLFSEERPVWHADQINEALEYSRATGYRYVKDLVEAGFLQKVSAGRYSLGTRIIELDYLLRRSDPVLLAAAPVMDELSRKARLDSVMSALFGMKVIDTYRVSHDASLQPVYGRGRPRPLFQGAAPKVLISRLPRPQLVRIYEAHAAEIAERGLGDSWTAFRTLMSEIREHGFYLSRGELETDIDAAAVPIAGADGDVVAVLALVGSRANIDRLGERRLHTMLAAAATDISQELKR